ncbi:MAG TPA: MgtC/SapB family protein [Actinobacteria bacterium]|nr:MgtC/SapB family protein [Actinomycetota bacterium]
MSEIDLVLRVVAAALLGAALGAEREINQKTAGLRTHTLVAAGAALFTVAGAFAFEGVGDPTRVAAQVVTGIGFIGAGGMIRSGFTVSGITTAATLWFAAALGMTVGFGMYLVAVVALVVALVVMVGFAPLRWRIRRVEHLRIVYRPGHGTLTPLFETINAIGAQVRNMSLVEEEGLRTVTLEVAGLGGEALDRLVAALRARDEVLRVETPDRPA